MTKSSLIRNVKNIYAYPKINTRPFYSISEGAEIGFIEKIVNNGIIFSNPIAFFRVLSTGKVISCDLGKYTDYDKKKVNNAILLRELVSVKFSAELIGAPWNGQLFKPIYALKIETPWECTKRMSM